MAIVKRYIAAKSIEQATRTLAEGPTTIFAGGTDVVPQTQAGVRQFQPTLMNINRLAELRSIAQSGNTIHLGALTTITEILRDDLLAQRVGVLVDAADSFASGQVRNTATLGGNICNASPAGDMIIPLLMLDAEVELACWRDGSVATRTVPLCEFFVGPGSTTMHPHELLTCIRIPHSAKNHVAVYAKFGTRPALDIAIVSIGIAGIRDNGCLHDVRVAFGAVAPTPIRGRSTEMALEGATLDEEHICKIARTTLDDISAISDVRASAWYRRELVCELTKRLLHEVSQAGN